MKNFKNISATKRNNLRLFFQLTFFALFGIMSLFSGQTAAQRPAIIGTIGADERAFVWQDASVPAIQNIVAGTVAGTRTHGVAYFGSDNALISDFGNSRVYVVRISTATVLSTINTAPSYNGTGTIAVAPNLTAALAMGGSATLNVIQ